MITILSTIVWGAPGWVIPAVLISVTALALVVWSYWRATAATWLRTSAGLLKAGGILALAWCLVEPLLSGSRPVPGANLFFLVADNSQSLRVKDRGQRQSRGERLKSQLVKTSPWQTRLGQDFDVRRYVFDTRVRPVADFNELSLDGNGSALLGALTTIARRFEDRPNAGVMLFTDGNATDLDGDSIDWSRLPAVYPVMLGKHVPARDISVSRISVTQTSFEAAPVSVLAEITSHGFEQQSIIAQLLDETGKELEQKTVTNLGDAKPLAIRFELRPEKRGISFYRVRAFAAGTEDQFESPATSLEATLVNNSRLVMVDRGGGPYRVLYVTGRPNWEFKFLRRAMEEDDEVDLVGLIRIAKKEPKFTFRGRTGETTNPLYRGFANQQNEQAEQYDQPVLLRLGTRDKDELSDGFPKAADQLFRYHAIILDDLEADFFTQDQMSLIQQFVSQRGGGFLMLGGQESFAKGEYRRTPIGELLPIYLDRLSETADPQHFRLALTREGWLQPWVRLRSTEHGEQLRLEQMPEFKTVNQTANIKPGASVLSHVESAAGKRFPALVVQRFGKGRVASLLIGDLWRWNLRRESHEESDLEKSWRQTVRWLVADVPQRIDSQMRRKDDEPSQPIEVLIRVRDEMFRPLDNASVVVKVMTPDAKEIELTAGPSTEKAGVYVCDFVPRKPGAYRASVVVTAADGSAVGKRETGWTFEAATDELRRLTPNRALLARIAEKTGGQFVSDDHLHDFVSSLPNRRIPVTKQWIYPLWNQWSVFFLAISCLVAEWGLRRWRGLP